MSTAIPNPPVTPTRPTAMATQNGARDMHKLVKESSSQVELKESKNLPEAILAIREPADKIEVPSTQLPPAVKDSLAPQSNPDQHEHDSEPDLAVNERAPSPHDLEPFDWDNFQARYLQAMGEAKEKEKALLSEFNDLANYFGIWAAAASEYDDERALKRLRTRETYVQRAEQSLDEKKKHYTQVVEAFKNALALLGGP